MSVRLQKKNFDLSQTLEMRVTERTKQLRTNELAEKQQIIINASKMSSLGEMAEA